MKRYLRTMMALLFMILIMPSYSFAATHDQIEDVSSDTATVYLGKILSANQDNKFPSVSDFSFRIEAVKGWDNANADAGISGKDIAASDMPLPTASDTDHHKITNSGNVTTVTIGDFNGSADTAKADTSREKFRTTPVNIHFEKAGYYMYKVTETGSVPENIPGIRYDDSSYYVVVYVCNKTDSEGNTVAGVYVHDITSFRNKPDTDYKPDLTDIQNITDNNNTEAAANTFENFEKTGRSEDEPGNDPETGLPEGPDKLEAYKFWNDMSTHDVVITNNVTGNLGDITKRFEMTVTLTGLEPGATYTTDIPAAYKTDKNLTSEEADIVSATTGTVNTQAKTFTSDSNGNAEFLIKLRDDEVFVMNALPTGATYKVEEHASDHIASYGITSTGQNAVISKASDENNTDQKALPTSVETVDGMSGSRSSADVDDQTVTVAFVNHRNLATVTGLPYYGDGVYVISLLILMTAAMISYKMIRRRDTM